MDKSCANCKNINLSIKECREDLGCIDFSKWVDAKKDNDVSCVCLNCANEISNDGDNTNCVDCEDYSKFKTIYIKTSLNKFEEYGRDLGKLVDRKQAAYGDSFGNAGKILKVLYPKGVSVEQYDDFLAITRIIDKMFRIATDKDALCENPFKDIAGYGLLGSVKK